MKKQVVFFFLIAALCLASCKPASSKAYDPGSKTAQPSGAIEAYEDVRGKDLSTLNLDRELIQTLWYNNSVRWSAQSGVLAQEILEKGKNPGLGIRKLHELGFTGKGVNVAIIDQNMVLDHPEYKGKIIQYKDFGTNQPADESSMHGPAVTSLLVGEEIGTAPGASLYFAAAPSWNADAQYYADALNWLVDENEKLPAGSKIRVVSVSAAPSGQGTPFTKNNAAWDAAFQRASEAGLLVLDCSHEHGLTAACYYDLNDPDDPTKCIPGWPGMEFEPRPGRLFIPTSFRTTAEEYNQGEFFYQYTGRGGLSWSVPYLAGVLALGWQVRPELDSARMLELLFATASLTPDGLKIINPPAFIEAVKAEE